MRIRTGTFYCVITNAGRGVHYTYFLEYSHELFDAMSDAGRNPTLWKVRHEADTSSRPLERYI